MIPKWRFVMKVKVRIVKKPQTQDQGKIAIVGTY
jgi:hypothetical protein